MARKRTKKRTHLGASNPEVDSAGHASARDPKSMVIRIGAGEVGSSVSQLAADVRKVMEPGTASRLKERRGNRLKDYAVMCGPLGVTHLLLFSRSESGNTNLRVALTPRGPTMNFRVEKYSLCKDVQRAQKHPKGGGKEFVTPPLLVMNNFTRPDSDSKSKVPKHLESLATTVFQSLFPPINPQATPLKSIRRVLLLNREQSEEDDGTFILNFRHYAITTKSTTVSKPLRRLNAAEQFMSSKTSKKGKMPNLGKLEDIADFLIGGEHGDGYMTDATSGSEMDTDAEVEVLDSTTRKVLSAKARQAAAQNDAEQEVEEENVERRAVKLVELGPRMRLRLTKVEEGLCSGKVMWHEYVNKSKAEIKELEKRWEKRRQEKEARRKEQKENVEKKKAAKAKNGGKAGEDEEDDDEFEYDYDSDMDVDEFDSEGLAGDAEYQVNEKMEEDGEWEDEEEEIANSRS
ncbi:mating SSF1 [Fusarium albosuccineum]|uniref:Mating SSF1 n=1 Tax=Fusarium albosuccineum TaxID=1237068 RepID=A0A8H4LRP8_9HYPO|nr:mating SSF1 [Fusarium albosuccineum]